MQEFLNGLATVFQFQYLLAIFAGVVVGIILGAIPGIGASAALAIFLPITYGLSVGAAVIFLIAIYAGAEYGGSISAIAINAPGTGGAAATILDGYPLTEKGMAGKALSVSLYASVLGGLISALVLVVFAPPLARVGLRFGPAEMFSLTLCGLAIISSFATSNVIKGVMSALLGLLVATVGIDPFVGFGRFTFEQTSLFNGIQMVPVMIGVFALTEAFRMLEKLQLDKKNKTLSTDLEQQKPIIQEGLSMKEFLTLPRTIFSGGIIGCIIGIIPGVGTSVAAFLSYDFCRRTSKKSEEFGTGCLEGVAAPEAANNAVVGGALIPALSLGIPGSSAIAILMAALIVHGVTPGPFLLRNEPDLVYLIFAGFFVSNLVMLVVGYLGIRGVLQILKVPVNVLAPSIIVVTFLGAWVYGYAYVDLIIMFVFGILGWIFTKLSIPVVPLVIGVILGALVERNLLAALLISQGDYSTFITKPISAVLLFAAISIIFISFKRPVKKLQKK